MSRSEKKYVDIYYSSDKSKNKHKKVFSRKRARKQRKGELKLALLNRKEEEVYSLKNYHYDLFGVLDWGYYANHREIKKLIEEDIQDGYFDMTGLWQKPKRKAYLKYRTRK